MSFNGPQVEKNWDVVVIGAGPAGASAARKAAVGGCRTLILERRRVVGRPVQCAEYVPLAVATKAAPSSWAQSVEGMLTFIEGRLCAENRWPGVVLHRERFDQDLARQAVEAGACLLEGSRVQTLQEGRVTFFREGRPHEVEAPILIGADGPLSRTAMALGLRHRAFLHGFQVRAGLRSPMTHTEVHFWPMFREGYGWVFPKGEWANVGLGVARSQAGRLPGLLGTFLEHLRRRGIIGSELQGRPTGGLVPVGGPHPVTAGGSILLAGDAAGHTDPITGGGIPNAILCGELAGQVASEALGSGDMELLARYEESWRDLLLPSLERALTHRRQACENWMRGSFQDLVRSHWVAFREYFSPGKG
jgi:digeranylgeranylglycerophospholipid reductase